MVLFKIVGVALAACIMLALLDTYSSHIKPVFLISTAALLVFITIPYARQMILQIHDLAVRSGFLIQPAQILVKCMLISFLTKTAADICSDCGQKLIAAQIETAGKIAVVMFNFPMLINIMDHIYGMLEL